MIEFLNKILPLFGWELIKRKITFRGQEREGGYIYLTSPELRGFSFMLEPGERDLKSIIDALDEPLEAYLEAHIAYQHGRAMRPDLTGMRITQRHPINLKAELC